MHDTLPRAAWFVVAASLIAYAGYLYVGSIVHSGETIADHTVIIRDSISKGEHHVSGMLMVPSSCDELTLRVSEVKDDLYLLSFSTWSEPSILCDYTPTARVFDTVVFAPSIGVRFIATLDTVALPVAVYPSLAHRSDYGN